MTCSICSKDITKLDVLQKEIHLNRCITKNTDTYCPVCSVSLLGLDELERNIHVNSCVNNNDSDFITTHTNYKKRKTKTNDTDNIYNNNNTDIDNIKHCIYCGYKFKNSTRLLKSRHISNCAELDIEYLLCHTIYNSDTNTNSDTNASGSDNIPDTTKLMLYIARLNDRINYLQVEIKEKTKLIQSNNIDNI